MQILVLVGTVASGKGEVAKILIEDGYTCIKFSDLLREQLLSQRIVSDRESLTILGNSLREKNGPAILAKMAIEKLKSMPGDRFLIDGSRNPAEILELQKLPSTFVIGIDANQELRKQRYLERAVAHRPEDVASVEEFYRVEAIESSSSPSGQNIPACLKLADIVITNEGTIAELRGEVERVRKLIETATGVEGQRFGRSKER